MDPSYRDRQGYYGRDLNPQHDIRHHHQQQQQQQQMQAPQQPPQLLPPHFAHQLPPHPQSLLQPSPHLAQHQGLHHTQAAFVLEQADQLRGREDCAPGSRHGGATILQQMIPGSGQILPGIHRSHHAQFADHAHQQLSHLSAATSQASYAPPSTSSSSSSAPHAQASLMDTTSSSHGDGGQGFESPPPGTSHPDRDSPSDDDGDAMVREASASIDMEVPVHPVHPHPQSTNSIDVDTPKKRAVRLALAATQHTASHQNSSTPPATTSTPLAALNTPIAPPNPSLVSPTLRGGPSLAQDVWKPDLPIGLAYRFTEDWKKIAGVSAERSLEKGAKFGPFNGKLLDEAKGSVRDSSWELCLRGKVFFYVDGQSKAHNNWMAFVESANLDDEQNLEAFQAYGDIYFRTTKVIDPGSPLKVFYSDEYASHIGFKTKLIDLCVKKDTGSFQCGSCDQTYTSAKRLLRHLKISHDPDRAHEMRPVVTWEPCNPATENTENEKPAPAKPVKMPPPPVKKPAPVLSENRSGTMGDEHYICTTCGKNFPTRGRLAAHETFHEYSTEHTCPICGEIQTNLNNLAKHMVTHKAKPFKCQSCEKAFHTRNMLSRHERMSHTYNHTCRVCGQHFVKKRECNRHEKMHPDWKNFKPVASGAPRMRRYKKVSYSDDEPEEGEFDFLPNAAREAEERKRSEVREEEEDEEVDESNPTLPKDMLGKRINYYDRPRPYKCHFCSKRYLSRKAQLDHEAERHTKKCRYKCTHCTSVFATEVRYVEHVKRHVENRPFQCGVCPAAFASESALTNHQGEHTGLKPVKCDICGKGFRTRHFMTAHKRRMHKVQQMRFACSFCNKPFSDKGNLIKHERRHKGIRPYVCLVCGRGFTSNYCLTSHSYTHTKEKHFGCPHCDQKFTLNQHLTNHIYKDHTSLAKNLDQSEQTSVPHATQNP